MAILHTSLLVWARARRPFDNACPNTAAHQTQCSNHCHSIDRERLAELLCHQLKEDPGRGCKPLGIQGARGALFKITLESHGYTFVGKGTIEAFVPTLEHEGQVYRKLAEHQGSLVPVYLGNIALPLTYFLDFHVSIVHMLLMSWAGEEAQKDSMAQMGLDERAEVARAEAELRGAGVEHCDVRMPNVLWNSEGGRVMLVDFDRSEILTRSPVLQDSVPNAEKPTHHD